VEEIKSITQLPSLGELSQWARSLGPSILTKNIHQIRSLAELSELPKLDDLFKKPYALSYLKRWIAK